MPEANKREYTAQSKSTPIVRGSKPSIPKGGKFPASPHEMDGKFEKCVGAQHKMKKLK